MKHITDTLPTLFWCNAPLEDEYLIIFEKLIFIMRVSSLMSLKDLPPKSSLLLKLICNTGKDIASFLISPRDHIIVFTSLYSHAQPHSLMYKNSLTLK